MASSPSEATPYLLIVEDEPELAHVLLEHFLSLGYRAESANNGSLALRKVMAADFDAVVCDMVMPTMPGDMFYLAVQRVKPALCERFVFITGHGETPGVREFLAGLSERVIAKPFNLDDLAEAVRTVVSGARGSEQGRELT